MRLLWASVLLLSVALSVADLPSCERAHCIHCQVDFIARMCPQACSACAKTVVEPTTGTKLRVFPENNRPPQPPVINQYVKNAAAQPLSLAPTRQAGVPTQVQQQRVQQQFVYQPQLQQQAPHAFAAPQAQVPALQYPTDTSTLAPLIEQPHADSLSPNLAHQPADLAQPLPEYQPGGSFPQLHPQNNYYQQQPQPSFQQPQQQNLFNGAQNIFAQPDNNGFNAGQNGFGGFGQQSSSAGQQSQLFNPFQPFFQAGNGANALDPLGLFNFGGSNAFAQGAPLAQVASNVTPSMPGSQPIQGYGQQATQAIQAPQQPLQAASTNFNGNYQQPQQQAIPNPLPQPQQPFMGMAGFQHPQPFQMPQLPPLPTIQMPQMPHIPPSPPAPVTIQQPLLQPQQQYHQQQNGQYQQQNQQQAQQQYQQTQQNTQGQNQPQYAQQNNNNGQRPQQQQQQTVQQRVPQSQQPQISTSIDSAPVNFQKYVDSGKPTAPVAAAQTCPRQPGWSPCITKDLANERFRNCCSRLGDGCTPLCNYDATLATMQLAVLTGRCPLNKVADMMICASGYEDATPCCEAYNVFEPGYEHCRPYCNPAAGLPREGPLSEKYKCLVKLSAIQQCFYVTQKP